MIQAPPDLVEYLQDMKRELEQQQLYCGREPVPLDPSHPQSEGRSANGCRMIEVQSRNPEWYRELCYTYLRGWDKHNRRGPLKKKPRTIIKRQSILRILNELIKKGKSCSKYTDDLIRIAQERKELMETEITDEQAAEMWEDVVI